MEGPGTCGWSCWDRRKLKRWTLPEYYRRWGQCMFTRTRTRFTKFVKSLSSQQIGSKEAHRRHRGGGFSRLQPAPPSRLSWAQPPVSSLRSGYGSSTLDRTPAAQRGRAPEAPLLNQESPIPSLILFSVVH